jgi:hypothetical protein
MKEFINSFRRPILIVLGILLVLSLFIKQCWNSSEVNSYLNPPRAEYDVPFEEFLINADSLINIYTKTGTHLEIPANSFEDSSGHQVSGIVNLKVREFHTPMEILRAGIPLQTNIRKNEFLESGGMIEIKATKDSKILKIQDGKSMGIDLAAFKNSPDFQLFNLSDSGYWNVQDTFKVIPNERRNKILKSLFSKLISKQKERPTDLIFELFSDIDISPEMEPWLGQKWLIKAENVTPQVKRALRVNWDSLSIKKKKNGEYFLEFHKDITYYRIEKKDEKRSFSFLAKPYDELTKSEDKHFSYDERMVKVDSINKEIQAEIARVKQEAEYLNSFKIRNMGIWNIDKIAKMDDYIPIYPSFDFTTNLKSVNKIRLFCIYEDANSVIEFNLDSKNPIYIAKNNKTKIVAILPGSDVRVVDSEYLNKLILKPNSRSHLITTIIDKTQFFKVSSP